MYFKTFLHFILGHLSILVWPPCQRDGRPRKPL